MSVNSKAKGKSGELELASYLRQAGWHDVRRTAQYCGNTGDASDLTGLPKIHVECKRVEHLNIDDALSQAKRDAENDGRVPAVFHRKNNTRWKVTMDIDDWLTLYREWVEGTAPYETTE